MISSFSVAQHEQQKQQQQKQQPHTVVEPPSYKIKLTTRDKELLKKLDMEHQKKLQAEKQRVEVEEKIVRVVPNPKSRQKVGGGVVTSQRG